MGLLVFRPRHAESREWGNDNRRIPLPFQHLGFSKGNAMHSFAKLCGRWSIPQMCTLYSSVSSKTIVPGLTWWCRHLCWRAATSARWARKPRKSSATKMSLQSTKASKTQWTILCFSEQIISDDTVLILKWFLSRCAWGARAQSAKRRKPRSK